MEINNRNVGKNLIKNNYIFLRKLFWNKNFHMDLMGIIDKWPSQYRNKPLGHAWITSFEEIRANDAKAERQRVNFINKLDDPSCSNFKKDIDSLMKKYDFGNEWFLTISDFIISDWIHPPGQNIDIEQRGKRVVLTLNPDTSLGDLEDIWPDIQKRQMKLWPDFKKTNYSPKLFKKFDTAIKDMIERATGDKTVYYEDMGDKYKVTDLDRVGKIFSSAKNTSKKADKKRVASLRKLRQRIKEK